MAGLFSRLGRKRAPRVWSAVVVAAGSARRMEGIDKMLTILGDVPVLVHTLRVFQDSPSITEIVVVTREDLLVEVAGLCRDFAFTKVSKVIKGGQERIHSVRAGVREVREDAELIAIHDGARPLLPPQVLEEVRPLLPPQVLEEVLHKAAQTGAAAPALPVTDTVKRGEDGLAVETLDRSTLFAVQTPQVFQADLIRAAVEKALEDGEVLTDDCAAVERLGMKVSLTPGSRENLKLTTPFDLIVGEAILQARERGEL